MTCMATRAQEFASGSLRVQPMSRFEAEQARLRSQLEQAPPTYIDRVMDDSEQAAGDAAPSNGASQALGVRTWLVESRAGWGRANDGGGALRASEAGVRTEYRQELPDYGDLLFQYDGRTFSGDPQAGLYGAGMLGQAGRARSDRVNLRVLGLPLTPQRFVDLTAGDFYAERTDGLQRHDRLAFGSTPLRGASVRLFDADGEVRAGAGVRGWLVGSPYPGFERSQGSRAWFGATRRIDGDAFAAVQVEQATAVPAYYTDAATGLGSGARDVRSVAASIGRDPWPLRDGEPRLRATLVASQVQSGTPEVARGSSVGLFVEGSLRLGAYRHSMGLYAARPNLHFGDASMMTGTQGGHWRVDHSTSRMSWGAGIDLDRAPIDPARSGPERTRRAISVNGQYVLGRETTLGANVYGTDISQQASRDAGSSWLEDLASTAPTSSSQRSLAASVYLQTRVMGWPRSRLGLTVQRNRAIAADSQTATGQELVWEQDWLDARTSSRDAELTTLLGYARDESGGMLRHYPTAGVQFRGRVFGNVDWQGNLRYSSRSGGLSTSRGLSGSVSVEQSWPAGLRLGATLSLNQARAALVQTSFDAPQVYRSDEKALQVYLRWQGRTGEAFTPIGVRTGAGSGDIEGRVFFDANRDGLPQTAEGPAAGVEVVLDGRFRTTTDRDGRFQFRSVTTGRHQLSIAVESVPLPWADRAGALAVEVPLRGIGSASMPLVQAVP